MEIWCHVCGGSQTYDEGEMGNRGAAFAKCAKCGQMIRVVNPSLETFLPEKTKKKLPSVTADVGADGQVLFLPTDKNLTLKALEGDDKDTVYPVATPRLTIGRENADVTLNDSQVSRLHCVLEISDNEIVLRDLGSTNGTQVDNKPIKTARLSGGSTFRVGDHVLQLIVTPKQP